MNPVILFIPALLVLLLAIVLIFKLLWNSTFPDLFGWKRISYWTSLKLILISMILFGGGLKYPFGYGASSTRAMGEGATTTTSWSVGSQSK